MKFPLSTGPAADQIGSSEPRLNALIRRRVISPPPPIVSGRRLWYREHVLQAAGALGLLTPELLRHLGEEVVHAD